MTPLQEAIARVREVMPEYEFTPSEKWAFDAILTAAEEAEGLRSELALAYKRHDDLLAAIDASAPTAAPALTRGLPTVPSQSSPERHGKSQLKRFAVQSAPQGEKE